LGVRVAVRIAFQAQTRHKVLPHVAEWRGEDGAIVALRQTLTGHLILDIHRIRRQGVSACRPRQSDDRAAGEQEERGEGRCSSY
jgi:hypothetical protein